MGMALSEKKKPAQGRAVARIGGMTFVGYMLVKAAVLVVLAFIAGFMGWLR
jgi:hypothetical protein